ncbi:hypothetical protein GO013_11290 [Pseudodesulfovibrio sp. JC047]|uniref:hypothetical protein n=1 Tax=Pseudodesulfovibrio sp. JC047 TaxID=2683199 RepID=UPI0013D7AAB4|nr:hypothetical protein [Pseudodesulfovibrio sp. JC047]NDV20006.1 hypothetical protein [Pseudodesulfovibrio sp. JC047]
MAVKKKKILLGVSLVKDGKTIPPGKVVSIPVKEADEMIAAGQAMDPSKVVDVDSVESNAVKAAQAEAKEVRKALQEAETRVEQAEKGITSLSEAVLGLDPDDPSLKDSIVEIQNNLKEAINA